MPDRQIDPAAETDRERNRRPSGQFGNQPHNDSGEVRIDRATTATILRSNTWDLQGYVDSGDPDLQIPASWSPALSVEQAVALAHPDQPVQTRMEMARSIHGDAHQVLVDDPDPLVRYLTLRDSTDLDQGDKDRLRQDPQVQAVDAAMTAGSIA